MLGANWGATAGERAVPQPCDVLLPHASVVLHRAISVAAPPSVVFRWLCQLKLAPYSYDLLDNFARRSPPRLVAGVERLEVGQRFMRIFALESFARDEHITLRARRTAVTYSTVPCDGCTRLVVRVRFAPPPNRLVSPLIARALALGDLAMMRKQLLTLKRLAETSAAPFV